MNSSLLLNGLIDRVLNWTRPHRTDRPSNVTALESRALTLAIVVGAGYAIQFVWLYFSNWLTEVSTWPYNTFLFDPADRFRDYANMVWMSGGLDPYNTHQRSAYPPLANLVYWFYSLFPLRMGLILFLAPPLVMFGLWGRHVLRGTAKCLRWIVVVPVFLLNYGVLFGVDRANLELNVAALLMGWWWLYERPGLKAEMGRSFLLGAAIAMKLHPALLLLLLLKDGRWRELLFVGSAGLLLTLGSAACFAGGAAKGLYDWLRMLGTIQSEVVGDVSFTHYGLSLLGAIRAVYFVSATENIPTWWNTIYSVSGLAVLGGTVVWLLRADIERWRVLGVVLVMLLLIPSVSYDYKLIHLTLLVPGLLRGSLEPKRQTFLLVCLGLLLVPKFYGILFAHSSTAIITNPVLLLAFGFALVLPEWDTNRQFLIIQNFFHRRERGFVIAALLLPAAIFLSLIWRFYLPIQEGWFHYYAMLIAEGQKPYVDFYSFIQPLPLLLSDFIRSLSELFIAFRIYGLIERIALFICVIIWLRRFASWTACYLGGLAGIFIYQGQTVDVFFSYYQTALLLTVVAALATDQLIRGSDEFMAALLAGAAVTAGFFCKQSSGALVGAVVTCFVLRTSIQRRRLMPLVAYSVGAFIIAGPILGYVASFGGLRPWWQQVFLGGSSSKGGGLLGVLFGFFTRTLAWHHVFAAMVLVFGATVFASVNDEARKDIGRWRWAIIGWSFGATVCVIAPWLWSGDFGRFYWMLNGRPTKIWLVAVAFAIFAISLLFWTYRAVLRSLDPRREPVVAASAICFAWMYAHGMSFSLEEHAALPGVPLLLALAYDGMQGRWGRLSHAAVGLLALTCVALTSVQRYTQMYSWWGWEEGAVFPEKATFKDPQLRGFRVLVKSRDIIERVQTLISQRAHPGDQVYTFPHLLFFNVITHTRQVGFSPIHYFDVCPDSVAIADAELLKKTAPPVIVWIELPPDSWAFHEQVFRNGKVSGQRAIERVVHDWVAKGQYRVVETFSTPAYGWPLHVIERVY